MLLSFHVWKGAVLFGMEPKPPVLQPTAHSLELSQPRHLLQYQSLPRPPLIPLAQLPEHAWFS